MKNFFIALEETMRVAAIMGLVIYGIFTIVQVTSFNYAIHDDKIAQYDAL